MSDRYKVFISFKNSDENGNETEECKNAQRIYSKLSKKGISTFYSNITLLEFGESAYMEAIDNAIDEAVIMVIICSKAEYLNARWIKYEWSNFNAEINSDAKPNGIIIPYVSKEIARTDRPMPLRNVETFYLEDNADDTVVDFITNYIKKVFPDFQFLKHSVDFSKLGSTYDPSSGNEFERLRIQANNTREADLPALQYCMDNLHTDKINILDVGCSYGFVAVDRFGKYDPNKVAVTGIDINEKCIAYAKEHHALPNYSYHFVNVEERDFEERLSGIMLAKGIEAFDLINMTLVLHHLKDPVKFLRRLRKFLKKDGFVIIRGSDDGSVLAFNDNGLVQRILDKHHSISGISDRVNGRKIYYQLYTSGYKHIRSFNSVKNIAGKDYDERQEIFDERFSYRINNIKNLLKLDPTNMTLLNDLDWMERALDKLSNLFGDESFWYQEIDFVFVARKS